jgi:hypothetical protein
MKRGRRLAISVLVGVLLTAAARLPFGFAEYMAVPGLLLASPFWPEGIHTGSGLGPAGIIAWLAVMWIGSFVAWTGVAYGAMSLVRKGPVNKRWLWSLGAAIALTILAWLEGKYFALWLTYPGYFVMWLLNAGFGLSFSIPGYLWFGSAANVAAWWGIFYLGSSVGGRIAQSRREKLRVA